MSKRRDIRNIYLPEGFAETWKKFMEICKREGSSGSDKIREFVREYVHRHEPGNPQRRLDVIMEHGSSNGPVCEKCGQPATRKCFTLGDEVLYLCDVHFPMYKKLLKGFQHI